MVDGCMLLVRRTDAVVGRHKLAVTKLRLLLTDDAPNQAAPVLGSSAHNLWRHVRLARTEVVVGVAVKKGN